MGIELKKDFSHINDNVEYLKGVSKKAIDKAKEVLLIAKEQEKQKLNNGFHYVSDGIRAMKLIKD